MMQNPMMRQMVSAQPHFVGHALINFSTVLTGRAIPKWRWSTSSVLSFEKNIFSDLSFLLQMPSMSEMASNPELRRLAEQFGGSGLGGNESGNGSGNPDMYS